MKILVTGSNGLVGQYLCNLLMEKGLDFIATSRGDNKNPLVKPAQYAAMDICDENTVARVVKEHRPTVIINTAAMANVDHCEQHHKACWQVNVEAVGHLINIAHRYKIHFIHLSTDFVFGGLKGSPYKEEDTVSAVSYYGESKIAAEQLLQKSGLDCWSIVRTIVVYGHLPSLSRSNLVLWVVNRLTSGMPINVVDDQSRMPTYAGDLVKGCLEIAARGAKGIFHLSGKEQFSILEAALQIAAYFKLDKSLINPISSASLNQVAKRPPVTGFSLEKSARVLGYKPLSFVEGLEEVAKSLA